MSSTTSLQAVSGAFCDRVLAYHADAGALDLSMGDTIRRRRFLPLASLVRHGAVEGERLNGAFMQSKFGGNYVDDYMSYCFGHSNGAEPTHFLPFAELSVSEDDEESGGMYIYLETIDGAVFAFDPEDDDADHIVDVAPSLATFFAEPLDRMQRGLIALPSAKAPPRTPRQEVHAGEALLTALLEGRIVELAQEANVHDLANALKERLSLKRNPEALHDAAAFLMQDPRISEVFVDDDDLKRLVAEFLGR